MSNFFFNGRAASDFGLVVEYYPERRAAKKKVETVSVPGRSGNLTLFEKSPAFENTVRSYQVYYKADEGGATSAARRIFQWLNSANGYKRLEDTYDEDVFRRARYVSENQTEIVFNRFGRMTINFDVDPRAFLKIGEFPIEVASGQKILNNWMESKPLIKITASEAGVLTVGGQTVTVLATPPGDIYVDSETMEIANGTTSLAHYVAMTDFPTLPNGETVITYTGGITAVELTPRWWQP